jgi:hypothetical protein
MGGSIREVHRLGMTGQERTPIADERASSRPDKSEETPGDGPSFGRKVEAPVGLPQGGVAQD